MSCRHHRTGREVTYILRRTEPTLNTMSDVSAVVQDNVTGATTPLRHHVRHSPTGFSWGYLGSGPADLALAILWDHLGEEPTPALYQDFKQAVCGPDADGAELVVGTFEIVGFIDHWKQSWPERPLTFGERVRSGRR